MGLAGGITFLLKDAFGAAGRETYVLAFIAPLLTIALILIVYGSLFPGFVPRPTSPSPVAIR